MSAYPSPLADCPLCCGQARPVTLKRDGMCWRCKRRRMIVELTGRRRERLLAEHAAWLERNPDPWQRAEQGACLFTLCRFSPGDLPAEVKAALGQRPRPLATMGSEVDEAGNSARDRRANRRAA